MWQTAKRLRDWKIKKKAPAATLFIGKRRMQSFCFQKNYSSVGSLSKSCRMPKMSIIDDS